MIPSGKFEKVFESISRDLNELGSKFSESTSQIPGLGEIIQAARDGSHGALNTFDITSRVAQYFAITSLKSAMIKDELELRKYLYKKVAQVTGDAYHSLGFEVKVIGRNEELMRNNNFLLVGNHMSYMDILAMGRAQETMFVTSVDMGEVPLLGHITKLAGCIHVERRHRGEIERDLKNIVEALQQGFNVMIYPEGTSSNGMQVLPFKKSLLMAAVEAQKDILPVVLKYVEVDGEPFGPHNADKICWYGDMSFGPHFLNVMKLKSLKAELHFLDPIKVTKESTRHELAEKAYQAINAVYMAPRQ